MLPVRACVCPPPHAPRALRSQTGLCSEKAALLSEVKALRHVQDGQDELHRQNLELQGELLSLRGQNARLEAELRVLMRGRDEGEEAPPHRRALS